ncbi:hypothetical protein LSCM1_00815 [Leishmania martiniquensis]|uniref:Uncharacterized protein n=1 Tax=Leishmania martiniquensis TaxID=1580590 RepID=A0A836GWZ0_9TRYP|nr:hypothetical protein LSCM1_00815 [Leishmania martiniquensis]
MSSSIGERHHVWSCATTLHVTLLTSHYTASSEKGDAVATSSNHATAGHRREAQPSSKASSSASAKVLGSEEMDVYSCSTAAEQLDTVARVLCAVMRQQGTTDKDGAADAARRIVLAKAVRDDVVQWVGAAAPGGDHRNLTPEPAAPTSAPLTAQAKNRESALPPRRPCSARSSSSHSITHSSLKPPESHHDMSGVEKGKRQSYLEKELPLCELVLLPGAASSASSFLIFVYRLVHEEEVLAALSALCAENHGSSAELKDAPANDSSETLAKEKHEARTSQAATIVTRALWSTVRPILRDHLHSTSGRTVPLHVPVVWAMADPRMLSGFFPHSVNDTDDIWSPLPCPISVPPSSMRSPDEAVAAERWVRLVPRAAFYLYDFSASSATVLNTLAVFQARHHQGGQSRANSARESCQASSSESTRKPISPRRGGGVRPPMAAAGKPTRANGPASGSGGSKGRNARGAAGAAAVAASAHVTSTPYQPSLQLRQLDMGIDTKAAPAEFPYCRINPRSLAYYLYSGGLVAPQQQTAAPTAPLPSLAELEMELTSYLSKMIAFQQAVMATSEADTAASAMGDTFERMWCSYAPLLQRMRAYVSNPAAILATDVGAGKEECSGVDTDPPAGGCQGASVTLEEAVRLSLYRPLPSDYRWPLPLWEVTALPIAPVPPVRLRCRGSDTVATSTNAMTDSIGQWAAALLSVVVDDGETAGYTEGKERAPLMSMLSRMVHLIDAYNGWSLKNSHTPPRDTSRNCRGATRGVAAEKAPGDDSVEAAGMLRRSTVSACCTGGVFNIMSAVCAWMAAVSESRVLHEPSCELAALCATAESPTLPSAEPDVTSSTAATASPPPSGLFRRYAQPFQRLLAPDCGSATGLMDAGALTAMLPMTPETTATEAVPAAAPAQRGKRRAVATAMCTNRKCTDVAPPPCPQEVSWMVRHVVAKNAGQFEVNVARGTDTVTPAAALTGWSPAMQDMATGLSSSLPTHQTTMATMNITTQSTGLLLQQQRLRQRRHTSGVAAKLQPYSQGVHLIKDMARNCFRRRPLTEAAVALQGALESSLAAPKSEAGAGEGRSVAVRTPSHQSRKASRAEFAGGSATGTQQVSALELLQRYLASVDPMQACLAAKPYEMKPQLPTRFPEHLQGKENVENEMLATRAAAENLKPRIYEHLLQQALLHQLLRETGLEPALQSAWLPPHGHVSPAAGEEVTYAHGDWSVTQQLPTSTIVASIVDFQERFGAHNVSWRSCALHYLPLPPANAAADESAGKGCAGATSSEEDKDGEVHRTSAYAHNALNVHPTRRVTHMWVAGVAVPDVPVAEYIKKDPRRSSDAKAGLGNLPPLGPRRSRTWVDVVPRAGTVTSVEVFALWQSLLQEGSDAKAATAKLSKATSGGATMPLRAGSVGLTMRAMHILIAQYMQRHAEVSTSLVGAKRVPSAPSDAILVPQDTPMRFDTHETLYPYGDAVVEVWVNEVQRLCRYIKATEVIANLHAAPSSMGDGNVHLTVHWDDGLLLTCARVNTREGCRDSVPPIDVMLTTCNVVLQRREGESHIHLRRYPNTSSSTMANTAVTLKELSGLSTAALPQGGVMETCATLLEERVTLYCVHHCLTEFPAATLVELEASSEEETNCKVDEHTGVVHRFYASGMQQLLFPTGAMMVRQPLTPVATNPSATKSTSQYCDTLVTLDGRCFVRTSSNTGGTSVNSTLSLSKADRPSAFRCVQARLSRANGTGMKGRPGADDAHAPPFTRSESTYDAVHHCHMRSRQDGLTVAEYVSLASHSDIGAPQNGARAGAVLARVVVFPDGTTVTTVAPREARRRALLPHPSGTSVSASLSSPTLCALLEELQAVEDSLFEAAAETPEHSIRWCVEGPTMPRMYLAPAPVAASEEEKDCMAAFAVVFGDGTVLQRRWAAAPTPPASPSPTAGAEVVASVEADEGDPLEGREADVSGAGGTPAYRGGTFETVLTRPSTSAVRVLHQHALATIEPADVLATITRVSPAAYAVGQGLVFFDFACGGGLRMVDGARCVWEVRGLAEVDTGPEVLHPERTCTFEELLRTLVSPHYSPHRLPRAAQLTYAREQLRETTAYTRRRATGWCPSLLRRMREIAEPFIRTAQLLRTDVLAPIEAATAAAEEQIICGGHAPNRVPSVVGRGGATVAARVTFLRDTAPQCMSRVLPVCFGQLDNGEAIRYWHASEVLPSLSESCASPTPAAASEPQVIQRLVPGVVTGSVLGYVSTSPGHTYAADAIGVLLCGHPAVTSGSGSVLWQRLANVARLALLCAGVLAPPIPPAIKPPLAASLGSGTTSSTRESTGAYAASLPPLAVLLHHGSRWLPAILQPPQQFGTYRRKPPTARAGAEIESVDVAWVRDSTAALSNAAVNTAYVQYVLDHVNPTTAVKTSRWALQREVVRKELHRHQQFAQLSHYHRVLSAQWPMEMPASARDEQIRLQARFGELQRGQRSGESPPARETRLPLLSAIGDPGSKGRLLV